MTVSRDTPDVSAVHLSTKVVSQIEEHVERTSFDSVSAYVEFVLEELLHQLDEQDQQHRAETEAEVKDRLETLGYLE